MDKIFGGIAVVQPCEKAVWFFAILAELLNLGEELASDAMDMEGDRVAGARSMPVLEGRKHTLKMSGAIFFLMNALSLLPFLSGWMGWVVYLH